MYHYFHRSPSHRRRSWRPRLASSSVVSALVLAIAWTPPALASSSPRGPSDLLAAALGSGQAMGITAISSSDVWVVGSSAGDTPGTYSGHWNGKRWKEVDTPDPDGSASAYLEDATATSSRSVWTVGYFDDTVGSTHTLVLRHKPAGWSIVPSPDVEGRLHSSLQGVGANSKNDVWAVGNSIDGSGVYHTLAEHWDGRRWQIVPTPDPDGSLGTLFGGVTALAATDAWASGVWIDGVGVAHTLAEHWDGNAWTIVATPDVEGSVFDFLFKVDALSPSDVWAAGYSVSSSGVQVSLAEHWDGSEWTIVPSADPPGSQAVTAVGLDMLSPSDGWMVGNYLVPGGSFSTLTEHWNGTKWKIVGSPSPPDSASYLWGVSALSSDDVWSAGYALGLHDGSVTVLHPHWNGTRWR